MNTAPTMLWAVLLDTWLGEIKREKQLRNEQGKLLLDGDGNPVTGYEIHTGVTGGRA